MGARDGPNILGSTLSSAMRTAMIENVAVDLVCRGGGGSDVWIDFALDGAIFKPCRGRSEYEIRWFLPDVAIFEIQSGAGNACVDSILIAKGNGNWRRPVLSPSVCKVTAWPSFLLHCFDGDIFQRDIIAFYFPRYKCGMCPSVSPWREVWYWRGRHTWWWCYRGLLHKSLCCWAMTG